MIMVQESNPGKIRLRHPLTAKRVIKFPYTLNLNQFRVSEVTQGYNFKYSDCVHKVLLCSTTSPTSLAVLVLYSKGYVGKLTVRVPDSQARNDETDDDSEDNEEVRYCWKTIKVRQKHQKWFFYLDDIIEYKEMYCAVDRKGKLYQFDTMAMTVAAVMVSEPICRGDIPTHRRKRLVVDHTSGVLHLVVRERTKVKTSFSVYKFNEQCKRWDVLEHLGRERVLFVGVDHSYFANAKDFQGCQGNCIVFAANCFTQYTGRDTPDGKLFGDTDVEIGVYRLGKGDNFRLLASAYPEFSASIWPPPTWFSGKSEYSDDEETESGSSSIGASDKGNTNKFKSLSDDHAEGMLTDSSGESSSDEDKDEEMVLDSSSQRSSKEHDSNGTTNSEEKDEEEIQRSSSNEQRCDIEANFSDEAVKNNIYSGPPLTLEYEEHNRGTSKMIYQENEEGLNNSAPNSQGQGFSPKTVFDANPTHVSPKACEKCSTTAKFEGVDVKSELLPTLETIRGNHGSLICEDSVRSKDIRACALESVAKLTITLQNTTGRSLTDSQADDIRSVMFDLQRLGLKVDWLEPTVKKALELHKSKPFIESIVLLNKRKADIDKEEKEFLAHITKVKQELQDDIACLSARIPFQERIDLDDCLGGGLF